MLIGAGGGPTASSINVFLSVISVVFGLLAGVSIFLSRRTESLRQMQDSTITALQGTITSLETDRTTSNSKITALEAQNTAQASQIELLTKQVLQTAKVDELRADLERSFAAMNNKLDRLSGRQDRQ